MAKKNTAVLAPKAYSKKKRKEKETTTQKTAPETAALFYIENTYPGSREMPLYRGECGPDDHAPGCSSFAHRSLPEESHGK